VVEAEEAVTTMIIDLPIKEVTELKELMQMTVSIEISINTIRIETESPRLLKTSSLEPNLMIYARS
jgi:hypothetical protein